MYVAQSRLKPYVNHRTRTLYLKPPIFLFSFQVSGNIAWAWMGMGLSLFRAGLPSQNCSGSLLSRSSTLDRADPNPIWYSHYNRVVSNSSSNTSIPSTIPKPSEIQNSGLHLRPLLRGPGHCDHRQAGVATHQAEPWRAESNFEASSCQ